MKNKLTKKNRNILLLLILLLLFILMLLAITLVLKPKNNTTEPEVKDRERIYTPYVRPETISLISEDSFFDAYDGNVSRDLIMEKITGFVYYIIDNKQQIGLISEEQVEKEYNKREEELNNIGITSIDDYNSIIKELKKIDNDELEFSYAIIDENTMKKDNNNVSAEFIVKFVSIDELKFEININDNDIPVTFKFTEGN